MANQFRIGHGYDLHRLQPGGKLLVFFQDNSDTSAGLLDVHTFGKIPLLSQGIQMPNDDDLISEIGTTTAAVPHANASTISPDATPSRHSSIVTGRCSTV